MNNISEEDSEEDSNLDINNVMNLMKEYKLLCYFDTYQSTKQFCKLYSFMNFSLENNCYALIDLMSVQKLINEHFKFLSLKKKYMNLLNESKNVLYYNNNGFHIKEHTFETLDEVKRALDNKMFL